MKIAFIGQKGIPAKSGGVERYTEEVATRMAERGHEVLVFSRSNYTGTKQSEYKKCKLIYPRYFESKHFEAISHTFFSILGLVGKDIDVIYLHSIGPALLVPLARILKPKTKIIFVFQCKDWFHQKWGLVARVSLKLGAWTGAKFSHQIITVSKLLQTEIWEKYGKKAILIPNGVPQAESYEMKEATEKFGLESNDYFLAVSRLIPHKGMHYLISAYNKLSTRKKLVIVGGASYTDDYVKKLRREVSHNKNIILTGELNGRILKELFSNAFAFVHPSENEGLPIVVLEAMSYGRAIIASDIPENKEALSDTGILFKNKSIDDLQIKMQEVLNYPEMTPKIGKQSVLCALDRYDWEKIVSKIEKVCDNNNLADQKDTQKAVLAQR